MASSSNLHIDFDEFGKFDVSILNDLIGDLRRLFHGLFPGLLVDRVVDFLDGPMSRLSANGMNQRGGKTPPPVRTWTSTLISSGPAMS